MQNVEWRSAVAQKLWRTGCGMGERGFNASATEGLPACFSPRLFDCWCDLKVALRGQRRKAGRGLWLAVGAAGSMVAGWRRWRVKVTAGIDDGVVGDGRLARRGQRGPFNL